MLLPSFNLQYSKGRFSKEKKILEPKHGGIIIEEKGVGRFSCRSNFHSNVSITLPHLSKKNWFIIGPGLLPIKLGSLLHVVAAIPLTNMGLFNQKCTTKVTLPYLFKNKSFYHLSSN